MHILTTLKRETRHVNNSQKKYKQTNKQKKKNNNTTSSLQTGHKVSPGCHARKIDHSKV